MDSDFSDRPGDEAESAMSTAQQTSSSLPPQQQQQFSEELNDYLASLPVHLRPFISANSSLVEVSGGDGGGCVLNSLREVRNSGNQAVGESMTFNFVAIIKRVVYLELTLEDRFLRDFQLRLVDNVNAGGLLSDEICRALQPGNFICARGVRMTENGGVCYTEVAKCVVSIVEVPFV